MVNLTKILAGLLIGVALLLGIFAWTLSRRPAPVSIAAPAPMYAVVVAAHGLPAGHAIEADDLQLQKFSFSPAGASADANALIGRVPLADIAPGSPVVETNLLAGLAGHLAPGERAVAIRVDELAGVGARVRPGDLVDLFMVLKRDATDGEIGRTQARLLLSKVRVLAYGRATIGSPNGAPNEASAANASVANNNPPVDAGTAPGSANGNNNDPTNAHTAVVAVPVEQVDALALADTAGRVVMALRNPADTDVADQNVFPPSGTVLIPTAGVAVLQSNPQNRAAAGLLLDQLVRDKSGNHEVAPMPTTVQSPLPATTRLSQVAMTKSSTGAVEVIRGDKRETVGW
jgi:pilus assembly protein CpaB